MNAENQPLIRRSVDYIRQIPSRWRYSWTLVTQGYQYTTKGYHRTTKGCQRTIRYTIYTFVSLLFGFGTCWLYLSKHGLKASSCCKTSFNYNTFYGIPANLPVIPSKDLVNHTQLDMKTGFVVSGTTTVREYTFDITQALAAPDGFQKPMIVINNQFPGPLIEANSGDTIRVHVNNLMTNWSTSIHWHGIDQKNTTWMDGVAAVSQCGIPPGQSFTYEFTVVGQRGTFWYHSHLSVQYTDGLFGPIIIHDPTELVPQVDEERIVFMGDWYHTYASVLVASYLNPTSVWMQELSGVDPIADNLLINGRNTYNCSIISTTFPPTHDGQPTPLCDPTQGSLYATKVKSGKAYRLRLINHSSFFSYWFSVDNHTIDIVEIDGVEIKPITFRGVNVNIGQRYSVIVRANQPVGNYYMRASIPTSCFLPFIPYFSSGLNSTGYRVTGILSYDNIDPAVPPIGVAGNTSNPYGAADNIYNNLVWEGCNDMPFGDPIPRRTLTAYDVSSGLNMHYLDFTFRQAQNVNRVFVNKTSWAPLENNATLWKTIGQKFDQGYASRGYNQNQQVLLLSDAGRGLGAQIVINSLDALVHPWHLHGHEFQIVGWGKGTYGQNPPTTKWNLGNPMRRDTVSIPANEHVVLRFLSDNPGMWAFHCHIAWHMEGGMFVQFLERPTDLLGLLAKKLDAKTLSKSLAFCYGSGDQAFGTEAEWKPANLEPGRLLTEGDRKVIIHPGDGAKADELK